MKIVILFFIILMIVFGFTKEIQENGCKFQVDINEQCSLQKNVYLKDTFPNDDDSIDDLFIKLKNTLNYWDKAGVWKKCMIISIGLIIMLNIIFLATKLNTLDKYHNLLVFIIFMCIIYFYHSFLNHHYFQNLKNNGEKIIELIKQKTKLKT